jgi:hypothetical protein
MAGQNHREEHDYWGARCGRFPPQHFLPFAPIILSRHDSVTAQAAKNFEQVCAGIIQYYRKMVTLTALNGKQTPEKLFTFGVIPVISVILFAP